MQDLEQAMDVQVADLQIAAVQSDLQQPRERVAYPAALQVVPTAFPAMLVAPMEPGGATRQCGPDLAAVFAWSEEQPLELATFLPAMRPVRHQPRAEAKDVQNTQEAVATPHALSSPTDQVT